MKQSGFQKKNDTVIILGDVVDRGAFALEIIMYIALLFMYNQMQLIFNQGNHETDGDLYSQRRLWYNYDGFNKELRDKNSYIQSDLTDLTKQNIEEFIQSGPIAVILVPKTIKPIWCAHGGMSHELNLKKFIQSDYEIHYMYSSTIITHITWNDIYSESTKEVNPTTRSRRRDGSMFGFNATKIGKMLGQNDLSFLIRHIKIILDTYLVILNKEK